MMKLLIQNKAAVDTMVDLLQSLDYPEQRTWPLERILAHVEHRSSKAPEELSAWSVALVGLAAGNRVRPLADWGVPDVEHALPRRNRLAQRDSIGTLPGSWDFVIDLEGPRERYRAPGKTTMSYNRMWEMRSPANPLLLVYVVDKSSSIRASGGRRSTQPRTDLFREDEQPVHLVGLGLTFPEAPLTPEERLLQREYWIRSDSEPFPGL